MEMIDTRPLNVRSEYQDLPIDTLKLLQNNLTNNVSILLFNIRTDGNKFAYSPGLYYGLPPGYHLR